MSGLEIVVAAGKTAGALGALARSSPWLVRKARRTFRRITRGYIEIPIFGAGGVGKSTAGLIIAGAEPDSAYRPYEESLWTEVVPLTGDIPGELKVAPGQQHRIGAHWPELFKRLSAGKSIGLINVVSFGFHSLEIRFAKESDSWVDGMSMADFRDAYTESKRALEIQLLREVIAGLSAVTTKMWMATVINKQDLWFKDHSRVMKHYEQGEYWSLIDSASSRLGSRYFQHELIPTSLALSNLTTKSGEIVAESSGGYDVEARNASLRELSTKLRVLVSQ